MAQLRGYGPGSCAGDRFQRESGGTGRRDLLPAHQAAEKYLKALLVSKDEEPPRIHALPELLQRVTMHSPELEGPRLREVATNLNAYYMTSRYPVEVGGPEGPITASEAADALNWAEAIAAEVRPRLESR